MPNFPRPIAAAVTLLLLFAALTGCGGTAGGERPAGDADRPYAGTTLTVSCPDTRLAGVLTPLAKAWATGAGARVEVITAPMTAGDAADVGVIPFAELGTWAEVGELHPVPANLKEAGHPYQWSAVLPVYRGEPFAGWGSRLYGLPLAADGHVVVYRTDRFADPQAKAEFEKEFGRPLAAPTTWEDFADTAAFFAARDGRPSLPPLPTTPGRLVDLFCRVAACYDRAARSEGTPGQGGRPADALALHFRLEDGHPRLNAPAFERAAAWLAGLSKRGCVPAGGSADAAAALAEGRAVLAVVSLGELARLRRGREAVTGYGVAPLPGTEVFLDPATGQPVPVAGNYVPYFAGGWLGVVRKRCANPEAAFALLADLAGPARSAEVVAAGGYGPTRDTHLDRDRLLAWYGYGFNEEWSKALQDALRLNVGKAVRNPTYGLRGPDHEALTAALAAELRRVAAGEASPAEGVRRATAAWQQATAGTPPEKLKEWRRKAAGLN